MYRTWGIREAMSKTSTALRWTFKVMQQGRVPDMEDEGNGSERRVQDHTPEHLKARNVRCTSMTMSNRCIGISSTFTEAEEYGIPGDYSTCTRQKSSWIPPRCPVYGNRLSATSYYRKELQLHKNEGHLNPPTLTFT